MEITDYRHTITSLARCPTCDASAKVYIVPNQITGGEYTEVRCGSGCEGAVYDPSLQNAIVEWNHRAEMMVREAKLTKE